MPRDPRLLLCVGSVIDRPAATWLPGWNGAWRRSGTTPNQSFIICIDDFDAAVFDELLGAHAEK